MKRIAIFVTMACAVIFTGCTSVKVGKYIPDISAQRIEYHRTGTVSGADVSITNLQQHPDKITADSITITVRYPFIGSVEVNATGYERKKETE